MASNRHPEVLFVVRFKSALPADELERRYKKRMPEFQALPGLIQKYYLRGPDPDDWGGFYLWDSQESLDAYLESDLRKSIPEVYEMVGKPRIDVLPVVDTLRP